jgi:predicted glycosyltransferase
MSKDSVLFHVQHLLGVGHVARTATLTRGMTAVGLEVTVVMGGEPVPHADFGGADVVQLPWIRAADTSFNTLLDEHGKPVDRALFERRRDRVLDLYRQVLPGALLIEHYPFGRGKFAAELEPLIAEVKGRSQILCSLRDVLVEKGDGVKSAKAVAIVKRSFGKVLVHGDRDVLPLELTFPRAADITDRLLYTGYVVDRRARAASTGSAGDGTNEIIVSIGGGAVGLNLLEAAIGAKRLGAGGGRTWRLLAGANLAHANLQRLCAEAPEGLIVEQARTDFPALLKRAALSISQAGYNTLMDVLQAGCRNILVPFAAGSESEQLFRARVFQQRGLVRVLDENALSPATLAEAADAAIAAPPPADMGGIDLTGVETTARMILDMIAGKRG